MKTNSNSYTIIYSAIIVVIVAFLLAFVYQALRPQQLANEALAKKKQILYSLNIRGLNDKDAEATYNKVVKSEKTVDGSEMYICNIGGKTKYVFSMTGMGLWGGISGFISVNDDKSTVYGAYFNHESETAGLGAEIKDNQKWQEQFQGKKLFKAISPNEDDRSAIALSVQKKVTDPQTQVDAVTGATLTSNGVSDMLHNGLTRFLPILNGSDN